VQNHTGNVSGLVLLKLCRKTELYWSDPESSTNCTFSRKNTSAVKYGGYSTRQSTNIGNKAMTAIFPCEATSEYSDDIVLQRSQVHKLQSASTNLSYFEALSHAQYLGL
jgi:hypothetical protein